MQTFPTLPPSRFPVRHLFGYVFLFILLITQQSCEIELHNEKARGSLDLSNTKETGPSKIDNDEIRNVNIAMDFMIGLSGVGMENSVGDYTAKTDQGTFMLMPGLELIGKGSKFGSTTSHLNYLTIPIPVIYQYPLEDKGSLFGGLGPYIGYGIGGKSGSGSFKVPSFGGDDGYKRFDAGIDLTAGYEMPSSLTFSLVYEWGLANISPEPDFGSHNRTFSLDIGYSIDRIIKGFKKK